MTRRGMSRLLALAALWAAVCLSLAACGGEEDKAPFTQEDVETLLTSGAFSEQLEPVDGELVCTLYGLDAAAAAGCTAYLSTGATAEELVLWTAAQEQDVQTLADACQARVDAQIAAYEDYGPAEVAKLEQALIQTRGNTVLLVVASDADAAAQAVDAMG